MSLADHPAPRPRVFCSACGESKYSEADARECRAWDVVLAALTPRQRADFEAFRGMGFSREGALAAIGRAALEPRRTW